MTLPTHCPGIRHRRQGFTLTELLVVMLIITILTSMVLGTFKYVQEKGKQSRAEAEVKALEAALESYKADNGSYPTDGITDALDPKTSFDPTSASYRSSSLALYKALSGDEDAQPATSPTGKVYFPFRDNMLDGTKQPSGLGFTTVTALIDPWKNSYGYSTANAVDTNKGYNPTFDLWSTGGKAAAADIVQWVKNW